MTLNEQHLFEKKKKQRTESAILTLLPVVPADSWPTATQLQIIFSSKRNALTFM
jgi:hypothetical protein